MITVRVDPPDQLWAVMVSHVLYQLSYLGISPSGRLAASKPVLSDAAGGVEGRRVP